MASFVKNTRLFLHHLNNRKYVALVGFAFGSYFKSSDFSHIRRANLSKLQISFPTVVVAEQATANNAFSRLPHYQMFYEHASIIFNDEPYMTPRNFIECVTVLKNTNYGAKVIDAATLENKLSKTPKLGKTKKLFTDLDEDGLISFTEYLFLVSVLSRPENGFHIAFKMFDRNMSEDLDIQEFMVVTELQTAKKSGNVTRLLNEDHVTQSTLLRHLFGKYGKGKLNFSRFKEFVNNLQTEVLWVEFQQYAHGRKKLGSYDLAQSIVRYSELDHTASKRAMDRVRKRVKRSATSSHHDEINFDDYKTFFKFIFLIDDFESALSMYTIAKRSVSKDQFQRAVKAVLGQPLHPMIVDTVFAMFDYNGDGCLNTKDFTSVIKTRLNRGCDHLNSQLRFKYWPRYIARLIRVRPTYRGEMLDWRFLSDRTLPKMRPKNEPDTYNEEKYSPVWFFSERHPWNLANRLSEAPYPEIDWCVIHPDAKRTTQKLQTLSPDNQLVFQGDRVQVLTGPDKGKVSVVKSLVKLRRLVFVRDLHLNVENNGGEYFRRERPLCMDRDVSGFAPSSLHVVQIALVDPSDGLPCEASWRFDDKGTRLRVSKRTGLVIPLPDEARILDDYTDPVNAPLNATDTPESVATAKTIDFSQRSVPLKTFEEDLTEALNLPKDFRKREKTYWY